jgi:hypothetical protein
MATSGLSTHRWTTSGPDDPSMYRFLCWQRSEATCRGHTAAHQSIGRWRTEERQFAKAQGEQRISQKGTVRRATDEYEGPQRRACSSGAPISIEELSSVLIQGKYRQRHRASGLPSNPHRYYTSVLKQLLIRPVAPRWGREGGILAP